MTIDEYLDGEELSEVRHEYTRGDCLRGVWRDPRPQPHQ